MGRGIVAMVNAAISDAPDAVKTALIFPGQGSQSPEMAAAYASHPLVAETLDEAAAAINVDLPALILDKTALGDTANTQPALLAICVGVFRAAKLPAICAAAGHSLGEYTALVCSGALAFADAVKLVRRRGELMREAADGGMAAIIGEAAAVEKCCATARENGAKIWPANYNSPQQIVVAGDAESIAACRQWTENPGIKRVLPLPVGAPSHCPLMQPAADLFVQELRAICWQTPSPPVIHNATLQAAAAADDIITALTAQLVRPVRWSETIARLAADGISQIYECGPGGVLCGLARRMPDAPRHLPLSCSADLQLAAQ